MRLTVLTNKMQQGFTLVELLVVIGILGVLVSALLATLDPLEQLKKGQDSSRLTVAREYSQAIQRYFASRNQFPWQVTGITNCTDPTTTGRTLDDATNTTGCISELISAGELKASFNTPSLPAVAIATGNKVTSYYDSTNNILRTCFLPGSKSQLKSGTLITPATGAACTPAANATPGSNTTCFVCAQ